MPGTATPKSKVEHKVLVVEDQGEIGLILDLVLNEKNIELDYVSTLLDAEEYLKKYNPQLIILDNQLPDGYGVDYISYVKKKYPGTKIIMISGLTTSRDVALANGADLFFEKPFSLEAISEAIDNLLA